MQPDHSALKTLKRSAREIRLAAVSLGCAKNRIDTEEMLGLLSASGFILTDDHHLADLIIVNTCSFIESAQQESINTILEIAGSKKNKNVKIIITGCLVEIFGAAILKKIPEIDGAIGAHSYRYLKKFMGIILGNKRAMVKKKPSENYNSLYPRIITAPPHSVNVKIAEGCSNRCHYCLIPKIRGHYRSRQPEAIVNEVKGLLEKGTREIILIAQDTTAYGSEREDLPDLAGLIELILELEQNFWLRIMYTYPSRIDDRLIDLIAHEKRICKYLDMPIQHVNDKILVDMSRSYNSVNLQETVSMIRLKVAGIALRTTCLVGYPGETKKQFDELLRFIEEHPFERLGAFAYSAQHSTVAATMAGQLPQRVIKKRVNKLMEKQKDIAQTLNLKMVGKRCKMLIDKEIGDTGKWYYGRTEFQAPEVDGGVYMRSRFKHQQGDWVPVKICAASPYNFFAIETGIL